MKTLVSSLAIALFLSVTPSISPAELIEINNASGHVVYDTITQQAWIWDLHAFTNMNYQETLSSIQTNYVDTHYFNYDSWHLASLSEMQNLWNYSVEELKVFNTVSPIVGYGTGSGWDNPSVDARGGRYDLLYPDEPYPGVPFHYLAYVYYHRTPTQDLGWIKSTLFDMATSDFARGEPLSDAFGAWVVSNPVPEPSPELSCDGFEPPMDKLVSVKNKNRVLPLKMELRDEYDAIIIDQDIVASPIVDINFTPEDPGDTWDEEIESVGHGNDGNQFVFTEEGIWQFNLKTKNFSGSGTYTIKAISGDTDEYILNPICEATFVIK